MRLKFIQTLWTLLGLGILTSVLLTIGIWNGWIGYMPPVEELQNPIDRYATQVYSADGKVIGTYNLNKDNRIHVPYDSISPNVIKALIATEDARFYEHSGIDFIALGRAIVKRGIMRQQSAGGGSTITQQLAKQLYSEHARSKIERIMQKPIEWIIALKLERFYTKEEIITMYLNYFDFLHNAVGIKMAANTYFNKEPYDLDINEAATLIGLCKNPSYFNPVRYAKRSEERRNVVLAQMVKEGYLSQSECDSYRSKPLTLNFHTVDHKDGSATYFREFLRKYMSATKPKRSDYPSWGQSQYYIDSIAWDNDPLYGWCNKNTKKDGTPYNIYTDGLKIKTTINSRMQRYAEEAVYQHIVGSLQPEFDKHKNSKSNFPFSSELSRKQLNGIMERAMRQSERWRAMSAAGYSEEEIRKSFHEEHDMTLFSYHGDVEKRMTPYDSIKYVKSFLRAGFMSLDPHSGEVKAYVGGLDYSHFQYDMVMLGRRQVGSTIKPFLYALAMENGMTPCDGVECYSPYPDWHVQGSGGYRSLKSALQHSNNGASTQLMYRFSRDGRAFVDFLNKFGVYTPGIAPNKTLCLGTCDVSVGEMVGGYTAFANHGIHVSPMFVTRIEDRDGNVLAQFQPRMNEVISEESAYKMLDIMTAVVDGGTAGRLRHRYGFEGQIAAKTGTTQRNSDAWFIGVTPQLVSGGWVGGEDRDIHLDNMSVAQGAAAALPIWAIYMRKVYKDKTLGYSDDAKFEIPEDFNPCYNPNKDPFETSVEDVFE